MERRPQKIVVHGNQDEAFNMERRNRETEDIKFTSEMSRTDTNRDEFIIVSDPSGDDLERFRFHVYFDPEFRV